MTGSLVFFQGLLPYLSDFGIKLRDTIHNSSSTKTSTHMRPMKSPLRTKNVSSELRLTSPQITSGSHQEVLWITSPHWFMMQEMPVFAHLAMSLRVSIARREA